MNYQLHRSVLWGAASMWPEKPPPSFQPSNLKHSTDQEAAPHPSCSLSPSQLQASKSHWEQKTGLTKYINPLQLGLASRLGSGLSQGYQSTIPRPVSTPNFQVNANPRVQPSTNKIQGTWSTAPGKSSLGKGVSSAWLARGCMGPATGWGAPRAAEAASSAQGNAARPVGPPTACKEKRNSQTRRLKHHSCGITVLAYFQNSRGPDHPGLALQRALLTAGDRAGDPAHSPYQTQFFITGLHNPKYPATRTFFIACTVITTGLSRNSQTKLLIGISYTVCYS